MKVDELTRRYQARVPLLERLLKEACFILEQCLEAEGIEIHRLEGRVKALDSFLDKAKREQVAKPLDQITDQCGLRIVCLFLGHIDSIAAMIRKNFVVLSEDNKIEGVDEHSFGYMAFHFICQLPKTCAGPRYDVIKKYPFEIQVRTIAMDAWATISHHLQYKKTADVPKWLRKDFNALSGLFYVADTHFEKFYQEAKTVQPAIASSVGSPGWESIELNLDTLREFLQKKYADRQRTDPATLSRLLSDLIFLGYETLGKLDSALSATEAAFLAMERKYPPGWGKKGERYFDSGVVWCSLRFIHEAMGLGLAEIAQQQYREFADLVGPSQSARSPKPRKKRDNPNRP